MCKPTKKLTRPATIAAICQNPTPQQVHAAATAYLAAGLSLIPISTGGTKQPATNLLPRQWSEQRQRDCRTWKVLQERRPTKSELKAWFLNDSSDACGLAVVAGAVSGNLEILDLDSCDVVEPWRQAVEEQAPGLYDRLVRVITPRPGLHVYYRCETISGNDKLAFVPDWDEESQKFKKKAVAETRGEGGYCLCPPSPAACHPRKQCYRFEDDKDLTMIPTISPAEREILLNAARGLNTWEETPRPAKKPARRNRPDYRAGLLPGDDFNMRAQWEDILRPHGWQLVERHANESENWCRPGKDFGTSATVNFENSGLFYVFSSNAEPFDSERAYNKFQAYTLLEHDGDYTAAARKLAQQGYGQSRPVLRNQCQNSSSKNPYAGLRLHSRPKSENAYRRA